MNKEKNSKIEEILGSLDGTSRASAPDFFYTRLQSRMEKQLLQPQAPKKFVFRPAFAIIALFLILIINAAVLLIRGNANDSGVIEPDSQSFATEYRLIDNTLAVYDLNHDR